jgi:hypothetical protein
LLASPPRKNGSEPQMYSSAVCPEAMATDPAGAEPPKVLAGVAMFATVRPPTTAARISCPAASTPITSSATVRPAIMTAASTTGMTTSSSVWYRTSPGRTAGRVS